MRVWEKHQLLTTKKMAISKWMDDLHKRLLHIFSDFKASLKLHKIVKSPLLTLSSCLAFLLKFVSLLFCSLWSLMPQILTSQL